MTTTQPMPTEAEVKSLTAAIKADGWKQGFRVVTPEELYVVFTNGPRRFVLTPENFATTAGKGRFRVLQNDDCVDTFNTLGEAMIAARDLAGEVVVRDTLDGFRYPVKK
jgi:hypothetical protein